MKNFSFFYRPGSAGYVRGEQIAEYLNGKKNPTSGYEDDICIYVKIYPLGDIPKHTFIDVDDAPKAVNWLKSHPEVGVICNSLTSRDFLEAELNRSDINVIPHANCNYEKYLRPTGIIKTVGIIGSKDSFQADIEDFKKQLAKLDMDLVYEADYWNTYKNNREKVCDFYKNIDVQVVYRPKQVTPHLKNPNKLYNAGSFAIPTIAYPEFNFIKEWMGSFMEALTIEDMLRWLYTMKTDYRVYEEMAKRALIKASETHISQIGELYKNLWY